MAEVDGDLKAALEAVAEETEAEATQSESSPDTEAEEAQEAEAPEEVSETSRPKKGATNRIQQLVGQRDDALERLTKLEETLAQRDDELAKMVDVVQARDHEHQVVQRLNELHQDPQYTEMIETLDKAVRGVADQVQSGEATPEEGKEALKAINQARQELEDSIADERSNLIVDRAFDTLGKYFDSLVQETEGAYTDDDLRVLQELAVDRINWEALEEDASTLQDVVHAGLQKAVNDYGTPRGAIASESKNNSSEDATEGSREKGLSVEDFVNKPWGKIVTKTNAKGEQTSQPAVSDADFTKALAHLLKQQRDS